MDGTIASAVVLPEELSVPASPVNRQKRRQESISEDNTKRPRLSEDASTSDRRGSVNDKTPAPVRREKGRERRLFGAVLGALSQNPATTAQKRRTEIEKRQQAQRKHEDHESEQRKTERAAKRKEQRWKEQKCFERGSMRIRHDNLLHMAHFLQTKAEPRLYYKPWETSSEEDGHIQGQIADAEDIIKHEVEEDEARQQQDSHTSEETGRDARTSETGKSQTADAPEDTSTTNGGTNGSAHSPQDLDMKVDHPDKPGTEAVRNGNEDATADVQDTNVPSHETVADEPSPSKVDDDDQNGEVVEEAAEDTVIY